MNLREEFLEFIRDRLALRTSTISISIPTLISLLSVIAGRIDILTVSIYILIVVFIASNSVYILLAQKEVLTVSVRGEDPTKKLIHRYRFFLPVARGGLVLSVLLTSVFYFMPPFNRPVNIIVHGTLTPIPTNTSTSTATGTSTFTSTPNPTPTVISDATYILIVLDASAEMQEPFDTTTKWEAALESVRGIIAGLDPLANHGLVVIGGESMQSGDDPCREPSSLKVPFSNQAAVSAAIDQLEPTGGGSLYQAFTLANNQFRNMPPGGNGTLVYITGSSDICGQDEWAELKRLFQIPGPGGVVAQLFSEIIVIENDQAIRRTIQDQLEAVSPNLNVQAPTSISHIQQTNNTVINNFDNRIEVITANLPTSTPTLPLLPTMTRSLTPNSGLTVDILPTSTHIPPTFPPTITMTFVPTFTKSVTPSFTPWPNLVNITNPRNGASLNCSASDICPVTVTIQWIPDTQAVAQGLYLSVWVKPYPGNPDYLFYSQTQVAHLGNGVWQSDPVYIGQAGDEPGTPFAIYAIVTNQPYGSATQTTPLPAHSIGASIQVTR